MTNGRKTDPNSPKNAWMWFDPRSRDAGMWAYALNRITALGLVFYLFLHLVVLSQLSRGPAAYNGFISLVKSPVFVLGEFLVVVASLYHGLNGLRIALTSFGIVVPYQKQLWYAIFGLSVIGGLIFGMVMFSA
jgi:succinate dehydrogenase / fumarate reductase cytochrome b subunit